MRWLKILFWNKYYGDYDINHRGVGFDYENGKGYFSYRYIGRLNSGVEVVETFYNGGGSLTSSSVVFFQIFKSLWYSSK